MAEMMAWPLNLVEYGYNAEDIMRWMAGKTSGIYGQEGNYQVSHKSGMTVTVKAEGMLGGWLSNMNRYGIVFWNATDIDLTVSIGDGVNPRIDRVIVSWHIPNQSELPQVEVRKGEPAAEPQPPVLVNDGEYAEICLAEITVPAGAVEISQENITDTRLDEELCGLVSMGIEKIPTGGLEAQFMDWFEDLQTNLDGDVALNLQNQITGHISDTKVHLRTLTHSKYGTTHNLAGLSGVSGTVSCVFKATAAFNAGDTIRVDNTGYTIQLSNGEDPEDNLFVSGASVPVVIDTAGKKVNFKAAGGVKLPADVTALVGIFVANQTWTVPQTGNYRITCVGKGGDGGRGGNYDGASGGGSGAWCRSLLSLTKGTEIQITVNTAQSSFGNYLTATAGKSGSRGSGASGGTASGGNEINQKGAASSSADSKDGTSGAAIVNPGGSPFLIGAPGRGGESSAYTGTHKGEKPGISGDQKYSPFGNGGGGGARGIDSGGSSSGSPGGSTPPGAVIIELILE